MRFWQKIFLSTLVIFVIVFDAGAFILASYSYNFTLNRERENGIREHSVILASVENSIMIADRTYRNASREKERLRSIIEDFAIYYENLGVFLALYNINEVIYTNIPDLNKTLLGLENTEQKNIIDRRIGDKRYLLIASKIPNYEHLTFVCSRDITQLDDYRASISNVFLLVNAVICSLIGISIFILLKRMTRPIIQLNAITGEIANGAYGKRVAINRKDELGELGNTFNIMADSIEENMKQLTKSAENKQQFIDDLAHEIKTPLTAVLGYSEYLQNANSNEENRITAAGHLHDSAMRLKNLSAKLLDLTYLRNESIESNAIAVTALFKSLINISRPGIAEMGVNLKIISRLDTIRGDETLLLSLLSNLVENAARASSENDTITVRAYHAQSPVIEVIDTGCGMDEIEIKKITDPFYRVDKSRSRTFGGVGLGLSIARRIALLHHAKLNITSVKGAGTTVRIVFTTP